MFPVCVYKRKQTRAGLSSQVRGKNAANYVKWDEALNPEPFQREEKKRGRRVGGGEHWKESGSSLPLGAFGASSVPPFHFVLKNSRIS